MPDLSPDTEGVQTWMLFESGEAAVVGLSIHSLPSGGSRPIDAYLVTECEGDFTSAAQRAAESVYRVAGRSLSEEGSVVVAYDLVGIPGGCPLAGESGGLAFAIALAKMVFKHDPGPIAATGMITSGSGDGPVGRVKGIEAKLKAAVQVLPEDGWVFYPRANEGEISDHLRKTTENKGLKLKPVSSVLEALEELFPSSISQIKPESQPEATRQTKSEIKPAPSRWYYRTGLIILFLCIAASIVLWVNNGKLLLPFRTLDKNEDISSFSPITINLSGETIFTENLAKKLTKKLVDHFKQNSIAGSQQIRLSGTVTMVRITENTEKGTGNLRSEMSVKVNDLNFKNDKNIQSFPPILVRVKGLGAAGSLVPKAAEALFNEITGTVIVEKESALKPPKKKKSSKDKGKAKKDGKGFE